MAELCHSKGREILGEGPALSVLIISPNQPYRATLEEFLRRRSGVVVGAGFPDVKAVMKQIPQPRPDLAIVDFRSLDFRSIDNIVGARAIWADALIICLLDYIDELETALGSGANSCVLKDRGSSAIAQTLAALTGCHGGPPGPALDPTGVRGLPIRSAPSRPPASLAHPRSS